MADGTIKNYRKQVQERQAANRDSRGPVFPNIAQTKAQFDPQRDGPTTPAQLAADQREARDGPPQPAGLSQATVEGLRGIREAQEAAKPSVAPAPAESRAQLSEEEKRVVSDPELVNILRALREDPINNEAEREAVAKRVSPIDISQGLLEGEFTQLTPVVPDKLAVLYRSINGAEHQAIRLRIIRELIANPELQPLEPELMGLYQTVAAVAKVNSTTYDKHMVRGQDGKPTFNEELFTHKIALFLGMPLPLIGVLGVHATWFDQRVRELFSTADVLKNG